MSANRPGPDALSDDAREREPLRDQADFPAEEGIRSDHAGTSATLAGVSPGGTEAVRATEVRAQDREGEPPAGQGTGAGGGYGVGSFRGSGGSGEGTDPAGADGQTAWLRGSTGGEAEAGSSGETDETRAVDEDDRR